eukprot:gene23041-17433_t
MKAMLQQMKDEELKTREMEKKYEAPATGAFGGLAQSGVRQAGSSSTPSATSPTDRSKTKSHNAVTASQLHAVTALPQRLDDAFDRLDSGH